MELGDLYNFVLLLVLVGMVLGVGVLTLDKFGGAAGISPAASTAINNSRTALGDISTTWMSLIVTISVLAIILGLVIRSFRNGAN